MKIAHSFVAGALVALALASSAAYSLPTGAAPASAQAAQASPAQATPESTADAGHQRLLPLEGGQNFRDLGGYRAADGRHVKWGLLFRSGAMNRLTPADFATLRRMGIATVCDFRDNRERASAPARWPEEGAPHVLFTEYESADNAAIFRALTQPGMDGERTRTMMAGFYRELPYQFAGQYRRMFGELLAGHVPLAFNCSAGKDRTGVAAALLLTALGVDRDTVMEDYLLSNRYFRPERAMSEDAPEMAFFRSLPQDVVTALMGVDARYLDASFAAIEERSGGIRAYYRDELGLSDADIARLRALYLE